MIDRDKDNGRQSAEGEGRDESGEVEDVAGGAGGMTGVGGALSAEAAALGLDGPLRAPTAGKSRAPADEGESGGGSGRA